MGMFLIIFYLLQINDVLYASLQCWSVSSMFSVSVLGVRMLTLDGIFIYKTVLTCISIEVHHLC